MERSNNRFLQAGTILVPKPEHVEYYTKLNWLQHIVTIEEEKQNVTLGEKWMIKSN